MNKQRRKELTQLKYKKRIKLWVSNLDIYICRDGSRVIQPKTRDVLKDMGMLRFKSQSTLCSCYMCSGYKKYRRAEKRRQDMILVREYWEEQIWWDV